MSRERYGGGSVYEVKDGSGWMASFYDGDGRRRRSRAGSKREAIAELRRLQREDDAGLAGDATLGDLIEDWLAKVAAAMFEGTRENYTWALEQVGEGLLKRKLKDLRPEHIEQELERLVTRKVVKTDRGGQTRPLSQSSISRVRGNLRKVIQWGVKRRYMDWNPAAEAELPIGATPRRETATHTAEERRDMYEAARGDRLEALMALLFAIGPRPGEALGLPWKNVHLDAGVLVIDQQLLQLKAGPEIGPTKGRGTLRSGRRQLMSPELVDVLRAHKARQAADQLVAPVWQNDFDLVFTNEMGGPLDRHNVLRWWKKMCRDAGVPETTPYGARHTWATVNADQGVPIKELSDAAGHTDLRMMTQGPYLHDMGRTADLREHQALLLPPGD
jgi:integrase